MGLRNSWRFFAAILVPLVLIPLPLKSDDIIVEEDGSSRPATKYKTAYVVILMAIFWLLEVVPLPVTALLPILLFPLLGIRDAYDVTKTYTQESNMIFLTGVIIALGLEYSNLHRRIAIRTMITVGSSPFRLLFGTMAVTGMLAMWMSSTTCVAMLVPVVVAIIDEIHEGPEMMSTERLKSFSRASTAFATYDPSDPLRKYSISSIPGPSEKDTRRRSTVFENSSLGRPGGSRTNRRYTLHQITPHGIHQSPTPVQGQSRQSLDHSILPPKSKQVAKVMAQIVLEGPSTQSKSPYESHLQSLQDVETGSLSDLRKNTETLNAKTPEVHFISPEEYMKEEKAMDKKKADVKKLFLFAMVYAANIGGTAILTTAGPNKVLKENLKPMNVDQDGKYLKLTFSTWLALNFPAMVVNLIIAWVYLSIQYNGMTYFTSFFKKKSTKEDEDAYVWKSNVVQTLLRQEYQKLGKIGFHEIAVGLIFTLVVCLWIFRETGENVSWGKLISGAATGDSTAAMIGVMLLFIIPKNWSFLRDDKAKYETLLDWNFVATKMPWGALLLLGSGFAIADAAVYSGLSDELGIGLVHVGENLSHNVLLLIVIILSTTVTEICSNVASSIILIPIIVSLSESLKIHPLFLTMPATVACSYTFMLPAAAPSNALVFAAGNFKTHEMMKNGFFMNVLCIAVLFVNTITYGDYLFDFHGYEYVSENS